MLKKNKLSIFLLAVVMMLSIYYINMPNDSEDSLVGTNEFTMRYHAFAEERVKILEEREVMFLEFENVLASSATTSEKENAHNSIQEILELTENEYLAEKKIVEMGYVDSLVNYNESVVTIQILDCEMSVEVYEQIFATMNSIFDDISRVEVKSIENV